MKKKLLVLLLAVISCVACFTGVTACSKKPSADGGDKHSHKWSAAWEKSITHHWHNCAAAGCNITDNSQKDGYAEHTAGAAATATTPQTCTVCGYVITPPLGHTHLTTLISANSASCTESGNISYYSCTCGKCFSDKDGTIEISLADTVTGKLGHDWESEWTVDVEATAEHVGSKSHHCSRCDEKTDVTEIPRLTVTTYNVIFNANGGKIDGKDTKTVTGTVNQKISRPNNPTRTDYTFTGWYKDGATSTLWNFDTDVITGATTLYAGWEQIITEYDVTFVLNYEGAVNTTKPTENGLITYIPVRSGYLFNGWWYSDGQTSDGSYILSEKFDTSKKVTQTGLTLYAEWVAQRTDDSQLYSPSVSISEDNVFTWNAVNNAQGYKIEVYSGTNKVIEQSLAVTSWTFPNNMTAGYYTVKIRANGDGETTVNSVWTEKYYSYHMLGYVDWHFNNATSILTWDAVKNATSYEIRINNTLKDTITYTTYDLSDLDAGKYTVTVIPVRDGWVSPSQTEYSVNKKRLKTPNVAVTENSSDCSYIISWQAVAHANTYRIKHHNTYIAVTGTSYTINNDSPVYDGNGIGEFTVCAYDSNADYFISGDSESLTVKRLYTVTLNKSDNAAGSVIGSNTYKFGESVTVSVNTNNGYIWIGWYDGNTKLTDNVNYTFTMPAANVTYTAKWCRVTVESSNNSAGSVNSLDGKYKVGDSATAVATGNNLGYTWLGWYDGETKLTGNLNYTFTMPSENQTLTAKWKVNDELNNFTFTSTSTALTITGVEDKSIIEITVPDYCTSIADYAFSGCESLESITVNENNSHYASQGGILYNKAKTQIIYVPQAIKGAVTIPDSVTSIGEYAFYGCKSLESITVNENNLHYASQGGILYNKAKTQIIYVPQAIKGAVMIPDSVTSIEEEAFRGCSGLTSITIPDSVTSIGEYAFYGCPIETATIPTIACEFIKNSALKNVIITSGTSIGNSAFYGCSSLTNITIPDSVTSIGDRAFYNCSGLTSITIPDSVKSIGEYAFYGCNSLTRISFSDIESYCELSSNYGFDSSKVYIGNQKLTEMAEIVIPNSVTSIGDRTFYGCSGLTNITIPDSVTSIGNSAFSGCSSLKYNEYENAYYLGNNTNKFVILIKVKNMSVTACTIHENTKFIHSDAFYGCSGLTSITIPDSVTSIENSAFSGCSGLTIITIPDSVTSIGGSLFQGCNLLAIYCEAASQPSSWYSYWNSNYPIVWDCKNNDKDKNGYEYSVINGIRYGLKDGKATVIRQPSNISGNITIPTSVTYKNETYSVMSIGGTAFYGCSGFTSITIPDSVTSIGDSAFSDCSGLMSITISDSVTSIGGNAFYRCVGLTSIIIPDSVTSIGFSLFYGCDNLTIYCEAASKPSGWDSVWNSERPVVWDCKNK